MFADAPVGTNTLLKRQRTLLLQQLAIASNGKLSQSQSNKAIPKQLKTELKLDPKAADLVRTEMTATGWLNLEKSGRTVSYAITEAGRQELGRLERYVPLLPASGSVHATSDDRLLVARRVYVLDALSRANGGTIPRSHLDAAFGGKPKLRVKELAAKYPDVLPFRDQQCLGLNPATVLAVLSDLAIDGEIRVIRTPALESYELTPAGRERLNRLRSQCPVLPPTGVRPSPAPNEAIRSARETILLLKLLEAPNNTLSGAMANGVSYPKAFKLNAATAWQIRNELARAGYIVTKWDGAQGYYSLTASGRRYLTLLSFDSFGEFKIKGTTITALLSAAREEVKPIAVAKATTDHHPHGPTPGDAQLEAAVMTVFHDLLRERFTVIDMVPIHEIRSEIAKRFGPHAASHAVFDELLLDLRRTRKVRLTSISDRSRATSQQLQDSIIAVGETFFYVEKAHDPATV